MPQIAHHEDIIIVRNINIGDPDHANHFSVTWNGVLFRIPPGGMRKMPRYLAFHYCKHLTNRMIERMDMEQFGRKMKTSRIRDPKLRNDLQKKILVAVEQYHIEDVADAQKELMKMYGDLNPDDTTAPMNLGDVDIPLEPPAISDLEVDDMGNPILSEIIPIANDQNGVGQDELDRVPLKRSKPELIAEAEELGLELTGDETKQELQDMILGF